LDRYLIAGLPISNVDGHLNIHMHPTVLAILLKLARQYDIRALRLPREPLGISLQLDARQRARKMMEAVTFRCLVRWALPRLATHRIQHPDQMFGLHQSGHVTEPYLLGVLAALPPGVTEIYSHASNVDAEAARWRPADYESEAELAALVSPRVRDALDTAQVRRITYRALVGLDSV
ncbi:MAG: ChbG/HpnK family deacetylase, partial [Gaiellaceae bacterium]